MAKKKNVSTTTPYMSYLVSSKRSVSEMIAWRTHELKADEVEFLMNLFWEWAQQDDSLQLHKFYTSIGIYEMDWDRLLDQSEDLAQMHKAVKKILGQRREEQAWKGKLDPKMVMYTLRLYNTDYRAAYDEERDNKLQLNKEGSKNIQLVMEQIPKTDKVPEKK